MKKSTILYLSIFILLALGILFLTQNKKTGTIQQSLKDFAVKDTASITKVILSDRNGTVAILERKSTAKWMINNKYTAFPERVELLLECIKRVEVKEPVQKSQIKNILKDMATSATKVQIFKGSEPAKIYYVGGTTQDYLGTYMLLENSDIPFITAIPGFEGYINIRYFTSERDWRNREIFNINPLELKSVEIKFPTAEANSFRMEKKENSFSMIGLKSNSTIPVSLSAGKELFYSVSKLDFDDFVKKQELLNRDSLLQSVPIFGIKIKLNNGSELPEFKMFQKTAESSTKQILKGNIDGDLFYGTLSTAPNEIFLVQRHTIKSVLYPSAYYLNR